MAGQKTETEITYHPLTADRWDDFEELFGKRGAYGGCWCMWWRTTRKQFEGQQGEGNRQAMQTLVNSGQVPGIMAYAEAKAIAWCSVAPRGDYASLNRSHVLKRLDDKPVWSIVCLFVDKSHRGKRVTIGLIQAAVEFVRSQGGKIIEAYPTQPKSDHLPPVSSFMGLPAMFEEAGFVVCAEPSPSKVIMRRVIS
ncbi:MAG: GNAT family N-acetyltransferase [Anaerolineae bacterium]|nr:GNAT family N-acetyltransferase [Anaerolineae bacterium]